MKKRLLLLIASILLCAFIGLSFYNYKVLCDSDCKYYNINGILVDYNYPHIILYDDNGGILKGTLKSYANLYVGQYLSVATSDDSVEFTFPANIGYIEQIQILQPPSEEKLRTALTFYKEHCPYNYMPK